MKAVVLAAGKSTRLHPLTYNTPKCLLEVGGETILDHQIKALIRAGINELVIVVGFEKEKIYKHLNEKNHPIEITYIYNETYGETKPILGGLSPIKDYLENPILFFHCDVLFEKDAIEKLIQHHDDSVILYKKDNWDEEAAKIVVDPETDQVLRMSKEIDKETSTGEYLQLVKFGKDFNTHLIEAITEREKQDRDGYTVDAFNDVVLNADLKVTGIDFDGFCMEIDTIEDYENAKKAWEEK